jgi:hypothetical protein
MIYVVTLHVSADKLGRVFDLVRGNAKVASMVPLARSQRAAPARNEERESATMARE